MEKKHKPKDKIYHSDRILGQLYDRVESVDFVPQYEQPFDKRILRAYKLDDAILKTARQIKSKYDTAMRRIMAQQEIKTEFEVWTTFVLSKPRVGSDYKIQEDMDKITGALKARFHDVCVEKAGSKDFSVLGPFVAAMYRVTKEEMDIALAECRSTKIVAGREVPKRKMEPTSMPLISFPWLFEKELGRIATGIDAYDDVEDLGLLSLSIKGAGQARARHTGGEVDEEDFIKMDDGFVVHRGEELDLFRPDEDSEDFSLDDEDFEYSQGQHKFAMGKSGEVVLDTSNYDAEIEQVKAPNDHKSLSKGKPSSEDETGVEDVVPRTVLDGFVDPRETAQHAHHVQTFAKDESSDAGSYIVIENGTRNHQPFKPNIRRPSPLLKTSLENSSIDEGTDDTLEDTPVDSPVCFTDTENGRISPNLDKLDLNGHTSPVTAPQSDEDAVEEEVTIDNVGEPSSLEKLARLNDS